MTPRRAEKARAIRARDWRSLSPVLDEWTQRGRPSFYNTNIQLAASVKLATIVTLVIHRGRVASVCRNRCTAPPWCLRKPLEVSPPIADGKD